jgi:uncharacterized protein YggU (UPF0235/DUF167 family)
MPIVEATSEGVKVFIKVVPSALRDELSGVLGNRLKVRVRSQPESGKANKAALLVLATALELKQSALAISQGTTSMHKTVEVCGSSIQYVTAKLNL